MALEITPNKNLDAMVLGEEIRYSLDCTNELGTMTVNSHAYTVFDSNGADVTATMSGGSAEVVGIIAFGVKAAALGSYSLQFIVTCNEALPDTITPYEFYVKLQVVIKDF